MHTVATSPPSTSAANPTDKHKNFQAKGPQLRTSWSVYVMINRCRRLRTCEKWRADASLSPVSMVTCSARFCVSTPAQRPVCRSVTAARLASFSVSCRRGKIQSAFHEKWYNPKSVYILMEMK